MKTGILLGLLAVSALTFPKIQIKEKSGTAQTNVPITLSVAFIEGEMTAIPLVKLAGMPTQSQSDIKRRWPDGSIKHAIISYTDYSLAANGTSTVTFSAGGTTDSTPISISSILATDFDAKAEFRINQIRYTVSARELLQATTNPVYWLKGPQATEFILRGRPKDSTGAISPDLLMQFLVRFSAGATGARISFECENILKTHRQDVIYGVKLYTGKTAPQLVYSKDSLTHFNMARWRKIANWGTTSGEIEIRYDRSYLIATGLVPRYDTTAIPTELTITGNLSWWNGSSHDILQNGIIEKSMGNTGARDDIGPNPTWVARYFLSQDNRMREVALGAADLSGSFSIHWRESDSVRTLSLFTYPTFTLDNWQWAADKPPTPTGTCSTPYSVDASHQPNLVYIPYLLSGDYYYLEELYYWSNWNILKCAVDAPSRPDHSKGVFSDQVRGVAWSLRTMGEAAAIAPDNHFEKVYFDSLVKNNIRYHVNRLRNGGFLDSGLGVWDYWQFGDANQCGATIPYCASAFENDFMSISLDHLVDLGYTEALPLRNYTLRFLAGRLVGTNGYNRLCGTPYRFPTYTKDSLNANVRITTFAQAFKAMGNPTNCALSYPDCGQCYSFLARGALSSYVNSSVTGADTAFRFLDSILPVASVHTKDPTFALMAYGPRTTFITAAENNSHKKSSPASLRLTVNPNPASRGINISIQSETSVDGILDIFQPDGRKVFSHAIKKCSITISSLPAGTYFLRYATQKQTIHGKLLVIR